MDFYCLSMCACFETYTCPLCDILRNHLPVWESGENSKLFLQQCWSIGNTFLYVSEALLTVISWSSHILEKKKSFCKLQNDSRPKKITLTWPINLLTLNVGYVAIGFWFQLLCVCVEVQHTRRYWCIHKALQWGKWQYWVYNQPSYIKVWEGFLDSIEFQSFLFLFSLSFSASYRAKGMKNPILTVVWSNETLRRGISPAMFVRLHSGTVVLGAKCYFCFSLSDSPLYLNV